MPQPVGLLDFLEHLRNLHGLLRHHGNYKGTFEAALLEAQGLELIGSNGAVFNHRMSMQEFSNGLANNLAGIGRILEAVRTRDAERGSLLTNGVGPFVGLCQSRHELAQRTEQLVLRIAASPTDCNRLGGCPAGPRRRGSGGTVAQYLASLMANTGWTPPGGNGILSQALLMDGAVQAVLAKIDKMPVDGTKAAKEASDAARESRQIIANAAAKHRGASEEFSGYAAALERFWTPHGTLNE